MIKLAQLNRLRSGPLNFILKKSSLAAGTQIVGAGLTFGFHSFAARTLGLAEFGRFSMILSIAQVAAIVVPLGLPSSSMKMIAEYLAQSRELLARLVSVRAQQIILAFALAGSVAGGVVSLVMGNLAGLEVGVFAGGLAFVRYFDRSLRALGYIIASRLPEFVILPIFGLAYILAIRPHTADSLMGAQCVAAILINSAMFAFFWRKMPSVPGNVKAVTDMPELVRPALWIFLGSIAQVGMQRIDTILVGSFLSSSDAGLFFVAMRVSNLLTLPSGAIGVVVAPQLAATYSTGKRSQTRALFAGALVVLSITTFPLLLAVLLFPHLILMAFGAKFEASTLTLQIMAVGQAVNALTGPVGLALLMVGRERIFAWTFVVCLAAQVALDLYVIPRYGIVGTAIVNFTATVALNISQLYFVWRVIMVRGPQTPAQHV